MAPGDNLEFNPSRYYQSRVANMPNLNSAIEAQIRNRSDIGIEIAPGIFEFGLVSDGAEVVIFFGRKGNRIGLAGLYGVEEVENIEMKRQELKKLFGKGGQK